MLTLGQYIKYLDKHEIIRLHLSKRKDTIGNIISDYYNKKIKKIIRDIDCVNVYFIEE